MTSRQGGVDGNRMTVIQRVYLRAEKGMPVIHARNAAAAAAAATARMNTCWFPSLLPYLAQLGTRQKEKARRRHEISRLVQF